MKDIVEYPRIIISEDLLNIFDSFGLDGVEFEERFSCLKDFDDCVFFDFFDYYDSKSMDSLLALTSIYIDEKIQNGAPPRIMQKYRWFKNYIERVSEIYSGVR